jgi:hypothetical protein
METVCASDLNVAFLIGFGIELGATLIDTWMGRQTLMKMSMVDELIKLSVGSLMIVLGMQNMNLKIRKQFMCIDYVHTFAVSYLNYLSLAYFKMKIILQVILVTIIRS